MGVNSLRAQTAREAEQVIRSAPVHIAVVDLGLPLDAGTAGEEAGGRLLELLRRLHAPPPTVIVRSPGSSRDAGRDMSAALRADVFAVVERHATDVESMLRILHRAMDRYYHGRWPSA
jgi:DNA-binding NarL/FixJ family response regulator